MWLAVLIACHNRREKTLECFRALLRNKLPSGVSLHIILLDDGSTDGTAEAVVREFPQVEILFGDGTLFWNRSMYRAFARAMEIGFSNYLWLNDDTILHEHAIELLFSVQAAISEAVIVVGAVSDPETNHTTYAGSKYVSPYFRPFLCEVVHPGAQPQAVDVMNGNVVLIPDIVARKLGNLSPVFEHAMGDTDYSMRARRMGIRILLTAGYVGMCPRNSLIGTHLDRRLPLRQRFRYIFSRKGLPVRSWFTMCWRHGGVLWPVHFIWAYIRIIAGRR